ncbi:MAG: cell division protein FtsA [Alphaproteobacteria bacterium]|nr:cell division protein FtsA [Alphaproteobacteria bacterium]
MAAGRSQLLAALDIGSTKVCCFIARADADQTMRVIGIGHQLSRGVRAGTVVDMEATEESIRAAVDAAERMAGETVKEVHVAIAGGKPSAHTVGVEVAIAGHAISDSDLRRVLDQARPADDPGDREVIHSLPIGFSVDGASGVRDPRGMFGARLGVNINIVTVASGPLRNLTLCIERGHLKVASISVAPYASGLATLVEDELRLGVTVIDLGGGTTTIAVFRDGEMIFADAVALGGAHITNDIARGLATPMAQAERLKTLFGSALASPTDERETIDVPVIGETDNEVVQQVPRSALMGIIRPRVEETFEHVKGRLESAGMDRIAGRRVVITGGGSQLQGIREVAARLLDKQVRLGRPIRISGLAEATAGPAFSACAGLLRLAIKEPLAPVRDLEMDSAGGRLGRIGRWLKANF